MGHQKFKKMIVLVMLALLSTIVGAIRFLRAHSQKSNLAQVNKVFPMRWDTSNN